MIEYEELKDNLCEVRFRCTEILGSKNCVHHKTKKYCKFASISENRVICKNTIAQVQAISKYLKSIGIEFKLWK